MILPLAPTLSPHVIVHEKCGRSKEHSRILSSESKGISHTGLANSNGMIKKKSAHAASRQPGGLSVAFKPLRLRPRFFLVYYLLGEFFISYRYIDGDRLLNETHQQICILSLYRFGHLHLSGCLTTLFVSLHKVPDARSLVRVQPPMIHALPSPVYTDEIY